MRASDASLALNKAGLVGKSLLGLPNKMLLFELM